MRALPLSLLLLLPMPARGAPQICDAAPPLQLRGLDGAQLELPAGQVVVVDFFATWCGPCHQALAALDRLAQQHPGQFTLILVDVAEPRDVVERFFRSHPRPPGSLLALDPDGAAARRYGQRRFPTTFLLDRSARIRHINRGYGPGYPQRVGAWLSGLLRGGASPPGC